MAGSTTKLGEMVKKINRAKGKKKVSKPIPAADLKESWPWEGEPIKNSDLTEGKPKAKKKKKASK